MAVIFCYYLYGLKIVHRQFKRTLAGRLAPISCRREVFVSVFDCSIIFQMKKSV